MSERLERPASAVATVTGVGGSPGSRNATSKFLVAFEGGLLAMVDRRGPRRPKPW